MLCLVRAARKAWWWLVWLVGSAAVLSVWLFFVPGAVPKAEGSHLQRQINTHQGFDRCGSMSTVDLDAFWQGTAYWTVGIYTGGETAQYVGCFLPDASWVSTVRSRGWGIVFIWDGLQAPCTGQTYRMSWDPGVAYNQGTDAASASYTRVTSLGGDVLGIPEYLDIESYDANNVSCRNAVNAYIRGWSEGLAVRGDVPGVYSGSSGAILGLVLGECWRTRCPDNVWMARWNGVASVWGDSAVADSYWYWHQRMHQFRGGHAHTFNGRTLPSVDDDCNLAPVAGGLENHDPSEPDPRATHPSCPGNSSTHTP